MPRPRKRKPSTEAREIHLCISDTSYACICTIKNLCACIPVDPEKDVRERKQAVKDREEKILRERRPK